MNIEYVGRHFHLDDQTKAYAADKITKLGPFVEEPVEIRVLLETEKNRQKAEVHVSHRFGTFQAADEAENMLDSINHAVDKIVKQARRSRKKFIDKRRREGRHISHEESRWPIDVIERESVKQEGGPKVIRSGHIPIKPMTIDEAALSLESSRNDFFVFRDAGSGEVSVLYKRKDDNYGLVVTGT